MADFDDHLMEELLEGVEPPLDEIDRDLCNECAHDQVVPVLVAAGMSGAGVDALVRAIEHWFPSPADAPLTDAEGRPIAPDPAGRSSRRVIKTADPSAKRQALDRARAFGNDQGRCDPLPTSRKQDEKVRLGGLYRLQGKKQEPIAEAGPGSIVALARLDSVATGDTLTSAGP